MNPTLPPFSSLSGVRASEQVRNGERVLKKDMEAEAMATTNLSFLHYEGVGISARLLTNHNNAHHPINQDDVNGK